MSNWTMLVTTQTIWTDLTCENLEAVIKTQSGTDLKLECIQVSSTSVSYHIPDEGQHGAHINGVDLFNADSFAKNEG